MDPDAYQAEFGKTDTPEDTPFNKKQTPSEVTQCYRQSQVVVTQDNTRHQQLSNEIKIELARTGLGKDAIHAYCSAQKIPSNSQDCTVDQLGMIKRHLASQPTKQKTASAQEKIMDTTIDANAYERGTVTSK